MLNNEDLVEDEIKKVTKSSVKRVQFGSDEGQSDDQDEDDDDDGIFMNPLLFSTKENKERPKTRKEEKKLSDEEWSSDEDDGNDNKKMSKKEKREAVLGKRKKRAKNDVHDFFKNDEIEIVPQEKMPENDSDMDSDDMAETRALAKVMLRKKARNQILDSTYNRYTNFDDKALLPQWFVEEEQKHYRPNLPVTKEMVAEEKKILQEYNERPSKKVMEAKARKKRRLAKAMNKVKQKAQIIAEQDINEGSKMRQIQKLYKKEKTKMKEDKKYIVNKNFNTGGGKSKVARNTKLVDKRMKKDIKLEKAKAKKNKREGKAKNKMMQKKKKNKSN